MVFWQKNFTNESEACSRTSSVTTNNKKKGMIWPLICQKKAEFLLLLACLSTEQRRSQKSGLCIQSCLCLPHSRGTRARMHVSWAQVGISYYFQDIIISCSRSRGRTYCFFCSVAWYKLIIVGSCGFHVTLCCDALLLGYWNWTTNLRSEKSSGWGGGGIGGG